MTATSWPIAIVCVLGASTAAAQPPRKDAGPNDVDRRDRSAVSTTLGVFAPTGNLGLEYAHAVHRNLELSAGAGLGYLVVAVGDVFGDDHRIAPQLAVMPRFRTRFGALRVTLGAGLSAGELQEGYSPFSGEKGVDVMMGLWVNAEGGVQLISRGGWFGRVSLGTSYLVAHSVPVSTDAGRAPMEPSATVMPYLGAAVGRTL
jgi:hypothetical protein